MCESSLKANVCVNIFCLCLYRQLVTVVETHDTHSTNGRSAFENNSYDLQKQLHNSLANSLRQEVEMKKRICASPGEVLSTGYEAENSQLHESAIDTSFDVNAPVNENSFLSLSECRTPQEKVKIDNQETDFMHKPPLHLGPAIGLPHEFPSNISPIKQRVVSGNAHLKETSQHSPQHIDTDTQKILDFVRQMEIGFDYDSNISAEIGKLLLSHKKGGTNHGQQKHKKPNKENRRLKTELFVNKQGKKSKGCLNLDNNNEKSKKHDKNEDCSTKSSKSTYPRQRPDTQSHQVCFKFMHTI